MASFDAEHITSDGGEVLLRQVDVAPIFGAHCGGCHSCNSPTTLKKTSTTGECAGSPRIVAGNTDAGVMLSKISGNPVCGGSMPQG